MAQIMALYDPYRVKAPLKRVNEKGVPGKWVEISWDEALEIVGNKIREVRARDKRLLIWQKGRSKSSAFYDNAFVQASGATKLGHGAYCSDAIYRAAEYTIGFQGGLHPDFKHCRYLLSWGWNMVNAGGNKLCWITWNRQFLEARERGMKVVTIDPRRGGMGPHTDEWLPIKPGTDLAFFLALSNVLITKRFLDTEYLTKYTNAPFLVKDDGYFLKIDGKEQVWDLATDSVKPYDVRGVSPALEGDYTIGGRRAKTAFQAFKEHVEKYTPEWAESVCGIPAATIRRVGEELGQNAMIGSTIVLDGVKLPYRPVGTMAYHVAQQELGFQASRAAIITFMLLGAIGAVGGVHSDFGSKYALASYKALDEITVKDPPYNIYLKDSKFFPINSANPSIMAKVMLDPAKYGVDYIPEVLIIHMTNPLLSFVDQPVLMQAFKKFKFVVVIDPWLSETADYFADIVLPTATIEKFEGPLDASDGYMDAAALRLPPMKPLFNTRGDIDIYIDLCEKAGILYGEGGYIDQLNRELKLKDPYKLPLDKKPDVRDIFDRWAKSAGYEEGIAFFEKYGVRAKPWPANKVYPPATDPPFGGIRHRLYGESLKRYQDAMKEKGAPETYWRDYTALPTWRSPTMDNSPKEYDLYLISYKKIEFKQSRSTMIPLLNELEPEQRLIMNPTAARERGISDGDEVWVESHNAVTNETRKLKVKVQLMEGIRPDTVAMSHHYGFWVHPWAKGGGPTPNSIFFTGEGYVANTADQSFHVKVRVYKG
jgi:anaerobic selenocysteine-containing dehydrogenase